MREILLKVPDLGVDSAEVIEILVQPGDTIEREQSLVVLESDKASMEMPAEQSGKVLALRVKVGDQVRQNDVVAVIEAAEATKEASKADAQETSPTTEKTDQKRAVLLQDVPLPAPVASPPKEIPEPSASADEDQSLASASAVQQDAALLENGRVAAQQLFYAGPAVRRLAREFGIDLVQVEGSGRHQRILKEDVQRFVKHALDRTSAITAVTADALPKSSIDFSQYGDIEVRPMSKIQRLTAENMVRAWRSIPQVTQNESIDITRLEALRKAQQPFAKDQGVKLTLVAYLLKACVLALKKYPQFNAALDGANIVYKKYFHMGLAVDTPHGLMVPVIRDCDRRSCLEIARMMQEMVQKARGKKLKPIEMQGGCFTLSSLGNLGGTGFTPIVNPPEVAILGAARATHQLVYQDGGFFPRLMLPVCLSYDHRVINGADAARFTSFLKRTLENSEFVMG